MSYDEQPDAPLHGECAAEIERLTACLSKINDIRNSIIGLQSFNWSEHMYPLVAALDEAGFKCPPYEQARENVGTLLERANKAEDENARLTAENAALREERDVTARQFEAAWKEASVCQTERDALAATVDLLRDNISAGYCQAGPIEQRRMNAMLDGSEDPAAILAARDARVKAEALREAAEKVDLASYTARLELLRMADAIEKENGNG